VDEVIAEHAAAVADVRAGADKAIDFLTGQVMRRTRGRANAVLVGQLMREALVAGPAPGAANPEGSAASPTTPPGKEPD
jgi:hypothetical protein